MRVRAFAKINRSLRVLSTRRDGYHELRTIFQSIALHDTLTIRSTRGPFLLTCDDPACPADDTNLVARAAALMWTASGHRGALRGVAIDLRKRIPMQAGLGGGSSDAAATLRILAQRWRIGEATVRAAAVALGADVPYFLEGGTALGLERGDLLFPLIDPPREWVVLVVPDFGVSTKEAFAWFDRREREARSRIAPDEMVNDLEAPVVARHPEIGRIISALRRAGASTAAMSGSGSAVFGLFSSRPQALRAAKRLAPRSGRALVTKTLNRQTYQRLAAT
ncbi:MAG: 4-(cytidine 5'-diphospho)-2-C-methyl-D-erythritol kinase [Vicinamibacterales bacterium]